MMRMKAMNSTKKVITIAITICLLLGSLPAFAQYDGEILFRGVPWETDIVSYAGVVSDGMKEHDADFRYEIESSKETLVMFTGYSSSASTRTDTYYPIVECFEAVFTIVSDSFQVAGLDTDSVWLYAIPEIEDGAPLVGEENTDVVYAKYRMLLGSYTDKAAVYDGLCEKLTSLYGEPDATESYMRFWQGANDTFCVIIQYNDGTIEVGYGKTDLPERMEHLMRDPENIDTSTDGL